MALHQSSTSGNIKIYRGSDFSRPLLSRNKKTNFPISLIDVIVKGVLIKRSTYERFPLKIEPINSNNSDFRIIINNIETEKLSIGLYDIHITKHYKDGTISPPAIISIEVV